MPNIIIPDVYCPLCEKKMSTRQVSIHGKLATVVFCRDCDIGTYDFDPAFNKWRDADKKISCPVCGNDEMKWFIRYMDGFFKARCPRCRSVLKKDSDVTIAKNGQIIIPGEMEVDTPDDPVEVKIPLAHLTKRLGKDKINALKNKLREKE